LIDAISTDAPDRAALATPQGVAISYRSLRDQVARLATSMRAAGIRRGDRIAIVLPNGLEAVVAFLAAATAGTAAPLNPGYTVDELRFYMQDTGARALIVPPGGAEAARQAAPGEAVIFETQCDAAGEVVISAAPAAIGKTLDAAAPEDAALILHTSGTTSRPKRVPLSHANLVASARNIAASYALTPDDVSLCVMPLFHVHGLVGSTLATLVSGGKVVVASFSPLSFWTTLKESRATWYSAVPTLHQMALSRLRGDSRPAGADRLRFIRSCSAPLAPALMSELELKLGAPVLEAYGMTEASHQMSTNPLPPGTRKPGTVGRGAGVAIAIMGKDGSLLGAGRRGEVAISGPNVISAYEGNPEANASSFCNGWFRTGDEGILDPDGYLTLIGRIKELIVRGGEKISPREVDEVLALHEAVAEVATFGMPDRIYGEEVAAAVSLKRTVPEAELMAFCRERLAEFKCPKKIFILDAIPRTATGKIQRRHVAEKLIQ
jgi:acyl-CoA synthetase (AMP-forming)/AMP-acid ligase II